MGIKTVALDQLKADPVGALTECADLGSVLVVQLPDHRLITIQSLEADQDDDLINELLASNAAFRDMAVRSKSGSRKPFPLGPGA